MTTPQRGQFEKLGDHKFSIHKVFGPKTFKVPTDYNRKLHQASSILLIICSSPVFGRHNDVQVLGF